MPSRLPSALQRVESRRRTQRLHSRLRSLSRTNHRRFGLILRGIDAGSASTRYIPPHRPRPNEIALYTSFLLSLTRYVAERRENVRWLDRF